MSDEHTLGGPGRIHLSFNLAGEFMGWFILSQLFSTLISMVHLCRTSDDEKDLEILSSAINWISWTGSRNDLSGPTELRS
jgi:hypothetical protein